MTAEFSADEQARLAPFFTNLERDTFGLKLPQEVAGALFSRYSRSAKTFAPDFFGRVSRRSRAGLQDLLGGQVPAGDDSAALKKARAFYERVLVGYGDDSVAQLGGAHIACENISNVAAKLLEDARIGIAPLEKSTRYVRFDQKDSRRQLSLLPRAQDHGVAPPRRLSRSDESAIRDLLEANGTDARSRRRVAADRPARSARPGVGQRTELCRRQAKDDRLRRWAETAYRATVRAQACDVLRSYLPAAT